MGTGTTSPQVALDNGSSADWSNATIYANENYLVSNIVEFKVLVYLNDSNGEPLNASPTTGELIDGYVYVYGGTGGTDPATATTQLLYADVILTVVSDEGLELLRCWVKVAQGLDMKMTERILLKFRSFASTAIRLLDA